MPVLTIPNLLTFGRMVLTVFFFSAGLQAEWAWALLLFGIAAFTDMIDGTIARLLHQKSRFGAFIDPMADKLMMLGGVTLLTLHGILPWWLMALIVGRDLIIVGGLFYFMYRKITVEYKPTRLSKSTTFFQITTIVFGFGQALSVSSWPYFPGWASEGLVFFWPVLGVTTLLTLITSIQYIRIGLRILQSDYDEAA